MAKARQNLVRRIRREEDPESRARLEERQEPGARARRLKAKRDRLLGQIGRQLGMSRPREP